MKANILEDVSEHFLRDLEDHGLKLPDKFRIGLDEDDFLFVLFDGPGYLNLYPAAERHPDLVHYCCQVCDTEEVPLDQIVGIVHRKIAEIQEKLPKDVSASPEAATATAA